MPQWIWRPRELVGGDRGRALELHAGVPGEVGAAADQAGHDVDDRVDHLGARGPGRDLVADVPRRELGLPARQAALLEAGVELVGQRSFRRRERLFALQPRLVLGAPARPRLAVVREHVVGHEELFRREPEDRLHRRDLVGAERAAVGLGGVGVPGRGEPDVAAQDHQAGPFRLRHPGAEPGLERVEVVGRLAELHDVPAVAGEALDDVVGVRELGGPVDRDVVVVVDVDEPAEAEVAGERRRLVAHALLEVAVGADGEHVVVDDRRGRTAPAGSPPRARCPTPLAKPWPSGPVVTSMPAVCPYSGWPGRARPPLAELLEVVELEPVAGEVEHGVEQHRRVPGRQDEPVAVGPVGGGGVVAHDAGQQHVGERGQRHRGTGMTGVGLLHRVHRQPADHVDPALLDVGRLDVGRRHCAPSPVPRAGQTTAAHSEEGEARGEGVQEVPPADRPDLARAERAGRRERPEQLVDDAGVVVGDPEERLPAPVAGEEQRGGRGSTPASSSRRSSSAAAASRTWNCTVWPTSISSPTAIAPGRLIGAEHVAHQEVAPAELDLVLVDDDARGARRARIRARSSSVASSASPGADRARARRRAPRRGSGRSGSP